MEEEISMIQKNSTWKLVDRPLDRNIIGVERVFRTTLNADGLANKQKVRFVIKGHAKVSDLQTKITKLN